MEKLKPLCPHGIFKSKCKVCINEYHKVYERKRRSLGITYIPRSYTKKMCEHGLPHSTCKICINLERKEQRRQNRLKLNHKSRPYRVICKHSLVKSNCNICVNASKKAYKKAHPKKIDKNSDNYIRNQKKMKEDNYKRKIIVLMHYSNNVIQCANPFNIHKEPFTILEALTIDHINGGGNKHRKSLGKGKSKAGGAVLYRWLIKNNFPEGYQVLCMNCQFIKAIREKEQNI